MRGYLTEYETPYAVSEGKVFIPENCYITFLECLGRHNGKIISSVFEEVNAEGNMPVLGADTFGWEVMLIDEVNEKEIKEVFIPSECLEESSFRLMKEGMVVKLNDWTNRIMFDLNLPIITK